MADDRKLSSDDAWIFAGMTIRDLQEKFREGFTREYFLAQVVTRAANDLDSARYKVKDLKEKLAQAIAEVGMLEVILDAAKKTEKEYQLTKGDPK